MSKCSPNYNMLVPQAWEGLPDKPVDADTRQPSQEVVSENTANVTPHSPDDLVVFAPLVPRPDPNTPSTSISLARPNNDLISDEDRSTALDETIDNNTYKVDTEASRCMLDVLNEGNEASATWSLEVVREGAGTPRSHAKPIINQPAIDGLPAEAAEVHERLNERLQKNVELVPRVPVNSKPPDEAAIQVQRPSREAVSIENMSMLLRSLEATAALTPPTSMSVNPAYSCLRPS